MAESISEPPMVYLSEKRRLPQLDTKLLQKTNNYTNPPSLPLSNDLQQQVVQAYGYTTLGAPRTTPTKDNESMSDTTSVTGSGTASVLDTKYHSFPPSTTTYQSSRTGPPSSQGRPEEQSLPVAAEATSLYPYPTRRDGAKPDHGPNFTYEPLDESAETEQKDHAIWLLVSCATMRACKSWLTISPQVWLSLLDPLYSLVGAACALVTVFVVLLLAPLRLCTPACSLQNSTRHVLWPILALHLWLICAKVENSWECGASRLVVVYLFAPLISFGVAIATLISASFWVFTLIMGNPDGSERGDDGKDAVLVVRNWWAKYLKKTLR